MTQFELILTGYSIIIALCVARLLDGVRASFRSDRMYWVHSLWVVNKLMNTALYFSGTWVWRRMRFLLGTPAADVATRSSNRAW